MREFPYIRNLTNKASKIIQKYHTNDHSILDHEAQEEVEYEVYEAYVVDSLLSLGEIETVFEQLEQSPHFLSNYRSTNSLKRHGIKRFDHIIYHIESHLFRTTGILDRTLIHINIVLKIGLTSEKCKPYSLLTNNKGKPGKYSEKIRDTNQQLYDDLLCLLKLVDGLRVERNTITHQSRYQNEYLRLAEMYHIVQSGEDFNELDARYYQHRTKILMDEAVAIHKKRMLNTNSEIRDLLSRIYELLEPIWSNEYRKLIPLHNNG